MSEQTVRTARRKLPGRLLVGAGSALALGGFWVAIANGPQPAEATPSLAIAPAQGFAPAPLTQRDPRAFPGGFDSPGPARLIGGWRGRPRRLASARRRSRRPHPRRRRPLPL